MEDDNLLAEVNTRSVIRVERSLRSGKRMTDTSLCFCIFCILQRRSLIFFINFTCCIVILRLPSKMLMQMDL